MENKDIKKIGIYIHGGLKNTMSISTPQSPHNLLGKWNLYYHLPQDKSWDLTSYKVIQSEIDTAEEVIAINENIPENIVKNCMLFMMRTGIQPMWEDPKNRTGGCFSFKILNRMVYDIWKALIYALCGETLCIDPKYNRYINGITISPKKNFCVVKIWLENCNIQDPNVIIDIPGLSKVGCLFKKHEPEF